MAQQTFSISFHGPDVDDGQMDVDDFAPALIALDRLYREARRIATPDAPPVKLAVHGVRDGSLVVDLNLVQIVLGGLVDMLTSDESQALTALIEYVAGARGVLALIKKMRGRQPKAVEQTIGGVVLVITQDGEVVEVPASVFRGYESVTVRHQAREVMKPLGQEGVEQIEMRRESETTVSFGKDDREAFELPPGHTEEYEQETWLRVASPSFVPGHSWRLSEVDGELVGLQHHQRPSQRLHLIIRAIPTSHPQTRYSNTSSRSSHRRARREPTARTVRWPQRIHPRA